MIVIPDEPDPVQAGYAASFHRVCATGFSPGDFRYLGKVHVGAGHALA